MNKVVQAKNHLYIYEDGTSKVDCISGTYHLPLGHCSAEEVVSIRDCLGRVHNSYKEDDGSAAILGRSLNRHLNVDLHWHFVVTGAEAVERAVMCAVPPGGRLVIMEGAFHGKSFFTSKAHYQTGWDWPIDVKVIPWMAFDELPLTFDALLFEPVQGWDGKAATDLELAYLRKMCDIFDAKLIADEILCGLWRAGRAVYSRNAYPDILILGKGLAGALPIGAIGFKEDSTPPIGWTSTHGNYSLANQVAVQLLPVIASYQDVPNKRAAVWAAELGTWGHRVTGTMTYIKTKKPTADVVKALRERNFIVANHDPYLRILPCYTMPDYVHLDLIKNVEEVI